ncbi:MAG: hypothetical protein R6W90_00235 [Ignavibacteriaceae bacterium]
MKKILFTAIFLLPFLGIYAQGIGEMAPPKEPEIFPDNAFGMDIMFSEGGFGLGTFYRRQLSPTVTFFSDLSISEAKDENEFEFIGYDIYGRPIEFTPEKKNRVFLIPLNFGIQYRLFEDVIYDNLRPYINAAIGPTMALTTPYEKEFFSAFGKAQAKYAFGSYIGLGANFGLDKSSLVGINLRYYFVHFFDEGVESLRGRFNKDLGGVYLTINIGLMY